jgi:non-homologous end joining protein Ku
VALDDYRAQAAEGLAQRRGPSRELVRCSESIKIEKGMLDLAKHIVKSKSGHFEPDKFEDRYETALRGPTS